MWPVGGALYFEKMTQNLMYSLARSIFSKVSPLRITPQRYRVRKGSCGGSPGHFFPTATYTSSSTAKDDADQEQVDPKKKRKSRKSKSKDSDATLDEPSSDSQRKKKKSGKDEKSQKKRKKRVILSDEEIMDSLIGPFVPFEGTVEKSSCDKAVHSPDISFEKQDLPEGRFYQCQSSTSTYSFPSVTTVLGKTGSSYALLIWKRKLTELHGKEGFDAIRNSTLQSGINFHEVIT